MRETAPERGGASEKTILIVDDHALVRRGLTALVASEPDISVCAEAANCQAALEAIAQNRPDLVIVDLVLGEEDGLDLVKAIKARHPETPSLVLSMHDESVYAERSLRAGARGYITKQEIDDTLLVAIRRLLGGETYMSDQLERRLVTKYLGGRTLETESPLNVLSDRELQVFRLIGLGRTTRRIAVSLNLSIKTIESHREHIKNKLHLKSSAELAQCATQWVGTTGRGG